MNIKYTLKHHSFGKCKLKPRWDTITHLLGWLKKNDNVKCWQGYRATRTLTHCWWEWKIVETSLENMLATPYKVLRHLSFDLAISCLGVYSREMKTYVHTYMWWFTHNGVKMETTHISFNWLKSKQIVVPPSKVTLLHNKKDKLLIPTHTQMDET